MKKIALACFFMASAAFGFAQDSKVTTGVIAYDGGRTEEAIAKLNEALGNPSLLKPAFVPKANYYLFQSYLRVLSDSVLRSKHPEAIDKAYEAYTQATSTIAQAAKSDAKTFKNGLELGKMTLMNNLFNEGANAFNTKEYNRAIPAFDKVVNMDPANTYAMGLLGFAQFVNKDSVNALKTFEKAINTYSSARAANAEAKRDSGMIDVYGNASVLYAAQKDNNKALAVLDAGLKEFPGNDYLERSQLIIYQREPSLLQAALTKFEEASKKNPKDTNIALAYADMLGRVERNDEALKVYDEVLVNDPKNYQAAVNAGAFFVNKAAAINKELQVTKDDKTYTKLQDEMKASFEKAYPYIKRAHEIQPKNMDMIQQMIQITTWLNKTEEMMEYMNKKKALIGG